MVSVWKYFRVFFWCLFMYVVFYRMTLGEWPDHIVDPGSPVIVWIEETLE